MLSETEQKQRIEKRNNKPRRIGHVGQAYLEAQARKQAEAHAKTVDALARIAAARTQALLAPLARKVAA